MKYSRAPAIELVVSVAGGDLDLLDVVPVVHEGFEEHAQRPVTSTAVRMEAATCLTGSAGCPPRPPRPPRPWVPRLAEAEAERLRSGTNWELPRHEDECLPERSSYARPRKGRRDLLSKRRMDVSRFEPEF